MASGLKKSGLCPLGAARQILCDVVEETSGDKTKQSTSDPVLPFIELPAVGVCEGEYAEIHVFLTFM